MLSSVDAGARGARSVGRRTMRLALMTAALLTVSVASSAAAATPPDVGTLTLP